MGTGRQKELLKNVRDKIRGVDTDDLRMNQQSLAECLFRRKWYNPFLKFKFTERPDTASALSSGGKSRNSGRDNSPSAMILPTSIFDMIEEANDYYFSDTDQCPIRKISRTPDQSDDDISDAGLPAFMQNLNWLPKVFAFVAVKDTVNIPLDLSFLMLEVAIDGLRLQVTEYAKYVKGTCRVSGSQVWLWRIFGSIGVV